MATETKDVQNEQTKRATTVSELKVVTVSELAKRAGGKMWPWRLAEFGYHVDGKQVETRLTMTLMEMLRQKGVVCTYDKTRKRPVIYMACGNKTIAVVVKL